MAGRAISYCFFGASPGFRHSTLSNEHKLHEFVSFQVFPERQGKWKATTQSREFLKSIKRYYSNAYTDGEKQDAINL